MPVVHNLIDIISLNNVINDDSELLTYIGTVKEYS